MPTRELTAEEAASLLKDVSEEWKAFWFNHGLVAKNLAELSSALAATNAEQFAHHVNAEKNDLATWVDEALGDAALAGKLRLLASLEAAQRMVAKRVEELTAAAALATDAPAQIEVPAPKRARKPAPKRTAKKTVAKAEKASATRSPAAKKESVWSKLLKR